MQTATKATSEGTKPKGYVAPVHSPNEFHLGDQGELVNGLGTTQYPASVAPMSANEQAALADREQKVADAENLIEAKKQEALGQIAQEEARIAAEREAFEAEKAEFQKQRAAAASAKTDAKK